MEEEKKEDFEFDEKKFEKNMEMWFKKKFADGWDHKKKEGKMCKTGSAAGGGLYFIGWIGAIVYYIQSSTSFWDGVLGILKACVWPAFLIHGLMKYLGL